MDPSDLKQPSSNLPPLETGESGTTRLAEVLKNKWMLAGVVLFVALGIAVVIVLTSGGGTGNDTGESTATTPTAVPTLAGGGTSPTTVPFQLDTFTPEELEAIEAQSKIDEEVGAREREIKTKYPWFMSLPLRGEKHFVYFDTETETFVAHLYPTEGDVVARMQEVVRQQLKTVNKIPIESYEFDWRITPE